MDELRVEYTLPKSVRVLSILAGAYLVITTLTLTVMQLINKNFAFIFYASIVGVIIGALAILIVTLWQSKTSIIINNEELNIHLPSQRIGGSILWESVTQIGIGLSYITMNTEQTNYKIDFANLKYNDLRSIKSKIIEICEAKNIPFSNI